MTLWDLPPEIWDSMFYYFCLSIANDFEALSELETLDSTRLGLKK
jgi:hypothetical protein